MQRPLIITASLGAITPLDATPSGSQGFSFSTNDGDTYGGGTLTLYYRIKNSILSLSENPWMFLDTPTVEEQATYYVGAGMEIGINLTGATNPSITAVIGYLGT